MAIKPANRNLREVFAIYLHRHNMRCTAERYAICDAICASEAHFSIETLYERLENAGFHVSRATLYNTLELLTRAGIVRKHQFDGRSAKYECSAADGSNHHHLVCTMCGKIREVRNAEIDAQLSLARYGAFQTAYYDLNVYGLCAKCARQRKKNK